MSCAPDVPLNPSIVSMRGSGQWLYPQTAQIHKQMHHRALSASAQQVSDMRAEPLPCFPLQYISSDLDPYYPQVLPLIMSLLPALALLVQQVTRFCTSVVE